MNKTSNKRRVYPAVITLALAGCLPTDDAITLADEEPPELRAWSWVGWDPGLTIARAVGIALTGNPGYSFCPNEPAGVCDNLTIQDGWYNVTGGLDWLSSLSPDAVPIHYDCTPVPHGTPDHLRERGDIGNPDIYLHQDVLCPFFFDWQYDGQHLSALITADSFDFDNDITPNIFSGLLLNNQGAGSAAGLDANDPIKAPMLEDVDFVRFQYRASVCDPRTDGNYFGRGGFYLYLWNSQLNAGAELNINFFEYIRGVTRQEASSALVIGTAPQSELSPGNDAFSNTWQMEGAPLLNSVLWLDNGAYQLQQDPDCNGVADQGWTTVTIDINRMLKHLAEQPGFPQDPAFLQGARYVGGILGGIEMFGRGRTEFEFRGHAMYRDDATDPMLTGPYKPQTGSSVTKPAFGLWRDTQGINFLSNGSNALCLISCPAELNDLIVNVGPVSNYSGTIHDTGLTIDPQCSGASFHCGG